MIIPSAVKARSGPEVEVVPTHAAVKVLISYDTYDDVTVFSRILAHSRVIISRRHIRYTRTDRTNVKVLIQDTLGQAV